jgi:hypothetical protein
MKYPCPPYPCTGPGEGSLDSASLHPIIRPLARRTTKEGHCGTARGQTKYGARSFLSRKRSTACWMRVSASFNASMRSVGAPDVAHKVTPRLVRMHILSNPARCPSYYESCPGWILFMVAVDTCVDLTPSLLACDHDSSQVHVPHDRLLRQQGQLIEGQGELDRDFCSNLAGFVSGALYPGWGSLNAWC